MKCICLLSRGDLNISAVIRFLFLLQTLSLVFSRVSAFCALPAANDPTQLCRKAHSITVDSSVSDKYYAACHGLGVVRFASNVSTNLITSNCTDPWGVSFDRSSGSVYAACFSTGIFKLDSRGVKTQLATSNMFIADAQCFGARGVYWDSVGNRVLAACMNGIISISNSTVTTLFSSILCPDPYGVIANPFTGMVYAACFSGNVLTYDSTGLINTLYTSSQCPQPYGFVLNTASNEQYVACYGTVVLPLVTTTPYYTGVGLRTCRAG